MNRPPRSAPLLRASEVRALRGLIKAAPAVWPYSRAETPIERATRLAHEDMRAGVGRRMEIELARQADERAARAQQYDELAAAGSPTIDRAGDGQGQAPEGTRGAAAVVVEPANACPLAHEIKQSRAKAVVEAVSQVHASSVLAVQPVSRAAGGRSPAATSELMDATAGETAPLAETITCDRCQLRAPGPTAARMAADCIERPCSLRAIAA